MAFSISDLLSFFSQAADGQRMAPDQASAGILNQAGAGRGVVNPPMVNPSAPRPRGVPVAPPNPTDMRLAAGTQLPPMPITEVTPLPPISAALAEEPAAPDNPTDQRLAAGTQQSPMAAPQAAPGILSQIGDVYGKLRESGVLNRLGNGLIAAGSQDPGKMIALLQQADAEGAKVQEARRRAGQPKVDQINGTPFFQITYPDGRTEVTSNPALAEFFKKQGESKQNAAIEKAVVEDRLARTRDQEKADRKASDENRPLLNDIQGLKGRWQQAQEIVGSQGTMAQVQGIPGISGIAGFFGGDEVAKNKFLEGLTVDETLLNTARTKGAISNQEMMLFKSPIPAVTDDREKVWKPWIEQRLQVLDKLEKFYAGEVGRQPGRSDAAPAAAPPAAAGGIARPMSAADHAALPPGTRYIAPDGKVYTKK